MKNRQRKKWQRRPEETSAQWQAFRIYRDIGPARSRRKAWDRYATERGLKGDSPSGNFKRWCNENDWVERAEAWDRHVDEERQKALAESRERARSRLCERAEELADSLIAIALGEERAEPQQVRAITTALERIGVTDRIEVDVSDRIQHSKSQRLEEALENLEDKSTAELSRLYFETVNDGQNPSLG